MARIENFPPDLLEEHQAWHHSPPGGDPVNTFFEFHADVVRRALDFYGTHRNDVWPWPEVPPALRAQEGWDIAWSGLGGRTPQSDAEKAENRRPFEIPEPLDAFASQFPTERALALFIWDGLHQQFLHAAGALAYGEPELRDFHTSPLVTNFYCLHGMIEEWRQAYRRGAYRCGFAGNQGISVWVEEQAVAPDAVEFVLQSAPWITWWKQVIVPNGFGGRFVLETKNERHEDRNGLWAHEVLNGQSLDFWAGGAFGLGRHVAALGNLHRLPPGSRITFRWVQDWHAG